MVEEEGWFEQGNLNTAQRQEVVEIEGESV